MFGRVDGTTAWADLWQRPVNYDPAEVTTQGWNLDTHRTPLGVERPGPPERSGPWERACRLAESYEFCPPRIVQAVYDPAVPLLGREMLLQARFYAVHFYFGVRVTSVDDEQRDNGDRVSSWAYETLQGHLERGRMSYQVIKHHDSGRVEFVTTGYSQCSPSLSLLERLGWQLFGRWMQARFYRGCGARMQQQLRSGPPSSDARPTGPGTLRLAPSDARPGLLDRIAVHRLHPG